MKVKSERNRKWTILTKISAAQNEVAYSYHKVLGLNFLVVIFEVTIVGYIKLK